VSKSNLPNSNNFIFGSLYQWALLSFFIVIMPLVFTVIYTVSEVSNYTEKSQQTLFQTVNTTENSRIILERLISMERSIRQFQVLNEPEFFTTYQEQRQKFLDVMKSLNTTGLNPGLIEKLTALQHKEFQLYQKISIISEDNQQQLIKTDLNAFDPLTAQARILLAEG
jgi:two-component system sensor histidine kinase GlrK